MQKLVEMLEISFQPVHISGDRDVCAVHVDTLHDRVLAVGPSSLQIIGVRQGYFDRRLSFHSDRVIGREVSCQTQLWFWEIVVSGLE